MIGVQVWQDLLNGLGSLLSFLYNLVPNYGVSIILFTLLIRLVLLPLGIKQIRSMQAMQKVQPELKAIQQKYKGNRQKLAEEQMRLYKEHGVNPLGGCLPLLLQMPVLFALFSVLRMPSGLQHIPAESKLHTAIESQETNFAGANLLCNASQAGNPRVRVAVGEGERSPIEALECGEGLPVRLPYYLLALAMIGTTFYQQKQMQRASPPGASSQQQQMLTRVMPLLFGVWGFIFPAGLVLYWTTTNAVQIGQQYFLLRAKESSAASPPSPTEVSRADGKGKTAPGSTTRVSKKGQAHSSDRSAKRPGTSARNVASGDSNSAASKKAGSGNPGGRDARDRKKRGKR